MQNVRQCQEAYQLPRADRGERAFAEVKGSGQHPSTERETAPGSRAKDGAGAQCHTSGWEAEGELQGEPGLQLGVIATAPGWSPAQPPAPSIPEPCAAQQGNEVAKVIAWVLG